jgi:hydroxymethylbilane synthase
MTRIRIGTRASALAQWQANWVASSLRAGGVESELVLISTRGDQKTSQSAAELGSPGVFTKELQAALLNGEIDVAVHSLKDLPTDTVGGLMLAAVPLRASVSDVLLSRQGLSLKHLPAGATIGTGSLRRRALLLHERPDLVMQDIRGNVDTRLKKLAEGQYDAIILAQAGLVRLNLVAKITQVLDPHVIVPAVGQGALGIEARADDRATLEAVGQLDHWMTHKAVLAERALLARLQGGCLAPLGAWGKPFIDGKLRLLAAVASGDGKRRLTANLTRKIEDPVALGEAVAGKLLDQGAAELVAQSRGTT